MRLPGPVFGEFTEVLRDAFPTREMLARFVRIRLDENLAEIAGGNGLSEIIFNLVQWSEAVGRTEELLDWALEERPRDQRLHAFADRLRTPARIGHAPTTAEAAGTTSRELTPQGARQAWASRSSASEEAQTATPLRFERWASLARRQTALLSSTQGLYMRLSKTTEELLRYTNELSQGTARADRTWYIIAVHVADAQNSLRMIRQDSDDLLEGGSAQEFDRHIARLSSAITQATSLRPDEGQKMREQLDIMRSASMGVRASLKKQLDATLKSITGRGAVGHLVAEAGLLLLLWDDAVRRQESWDKCWQAAMATANQATPVSEEFRTLIYRWAEEAAQGFDEFINHIEAWTEAAMFERELREPAGVFRAAIDTVNESRHARSQDIMPVMREANDAAKELAAALLRVLNQWIGQIVERASTQNGLRDASQRP